MDTHPRERLHGSEKRKKKTREFHIERREEKKGRKKCNKNVFVRKKEKKKEKNETKRNERKESVCFLVSRSPLPSFYSNFILFFFYFSLFFLSSKKKYKINKSKLIFGIKL